MGYSPSALEQCREEKVDEIFILQHFFFLLPIISSKLNTLMSLLDLNVIDVEAFTINELVRNNEESRIYSFFNLPGNSC